MLNRLLVWQKFALLGVLSVVLVSIPLTLYIRTTNESIAAAALAARGVAPTQHLLKVVALTQQHRGMAAGALGGNATIKAQRPEKQKEADKAVQDATALFRAQIADGDL